MTNKYKEYADNFVNILKEEEAMNNGAVYRFVSSDSPFVVQGKITPLKIPAHEFLSDAGKQMVQRGQLRDQPEGERSMACIVRTFNALTGHELTESEGWEFMVLLKMVRGRQGHFNKDDYVDGSAYFSLLGECESTRERK